MRLDRFLCECDDITRSEAKKRIKNGLVSVNGAIAKDGKLTVDEENDTITLRGQKLTYAPFLYYLFNKPTGCVCANGDAFYKTVFSYVPMNARGDLFTVGRLDLDTEGLLLVTNDGELSHRLLSPRHHVEKLYELWLDAPAQYSDITSCREGIDIGEKNRTKPAELTIDPEDAKHAYLTITEGKFHQVKRMMHALGKEVVRLKRLRMGEFTLDPLLSPGEYRPLNDEEMNDVNKYKSGNL